MSDGRKTEILERLKDIGSKELAEQFFNLLHQLIQALSISPDDPRLALNIRNESNRRRISVNVNARLVLGLTRQYTGALDLVFMLYNADFEALREQYPIVKGGDDYADLSTCLARIDAEKLAALPPDALMEAWLRCCREYFPTQTTSQYRKYHIPLLYEMAVDEKVRQEFTTSAINGSPSAPQRQIIRRYLTRIEKDGNSDELYKWQLLGRKHWDLDAPDMLEMVKAIPFGNLVYPMGIAVLHRLALLFPEELRNALRVLFNDALALQERVTGFREQALQLYRRDEPKLNHHQDERSIATYLAFYNAEEYPLYKNSFYAKYCSLIGVKTAPTGSNYAHYTVLLKDFIETWLRPDAEAVQQATALLPEQAFQDKHLLLMGQDILYTTNLFRVLF